MPRVVLPLALGLSLAAVAVAKLRDGEPVVSPSTWVTAQERL